MRTAKTLSDWVDAQADLSLSWAHMPFCWFCHPVALIQLALRIFFLFFISCQSDCKNMYMSQAMRNVSYVICEQQRRRSHSASTQSDQRLCFRLDSIISLDSIAKISRL